MGDALIVRRGGMGSSLHTVTFISLVGSGSETIIYTGAASGTVSISDGTGSVLLSSGTYTFTSSNTVWTSGSVAIINDTTINCWYGTPLYWYGNVCDTLTGGWRKINSGATITFNTDSIKFVSGTANTMRWARTENKISFSNYDNLHFVIKFTTQSTTRNTQYGYLDNTSITSSTVYEYKAFSCTNESITKNDYLVLNGRSDEYYVGFGNDVGSGIANDLYACWLS